MTGPEMLLKALGLDPQAMKAALESTITNINSLAASMKEINARLEKIDGRLTSIEDKLNAVAVYIPVLQEVFAGRIAGESNEATDVWSVLSNADPEKVKAALEAVN